MHVFKFCRIGVKTAIILGIIIGGVFVIFVAQYISFPKNRNLYKERLARLNQVRSFIYSLGGDPQPWQNYDLYVVDLFDTDKEIIRTLAQKGMVICYMSAGTAEKWRQDYRDFPSDVMLGTYDEWPQEVWIDIRRYPLFIDIMYKRLLIAKSKGCHGVELDNIDVYQSFLYIRLKAAASYVKKLAGFAHSLGLLVAHKNSVDLLPYTYSYIDLIIIEECRDNGTCNGLFNPDSKLILDIEYSKTPQEICLSALYRGGILMGVSCKELRPECWTFCQR